MPTLYILAGCNGAGKTTASKFLLPEVFKATIFINADIIAASLNATNPEIVALKAGRIMLEQIQQRLEKRETFAIETTLATRSYFNLVRQAQLLEFEVVLLFYFLPSAEMAMERVRLRVSKGGHNIPSEVIERRYFLGIRYFFDYIKLVDRWYIYENSQSPPLKIAEGERDKLKNLTNFELWERLKQI